MRDSRGRFASTPGSKVKPSGLPRRQPRKAGTPPPQRRGLVTQRAAVRRSAGKLRKLDPSNTSYSGTLKRRAQKAAVTRAGNKLAAAKVTGRRTMALKPAAGILKRQKDRQPVKGKEPAPQPPKNREINPAAHMATIGRKRVRLSGRLINMNARSPVQFQPPAKQPNPFINGPDYYTTDDKASRLANIQAAKRMLESMGVTVKVYSGNQKTLAKAEPGTNVVSLNRASLAWQNPALMSRRERLTGFWSGSSPTLVLHHEVGHTKDKNQQKRETRLGEFWAYATREGPVDQRIARGDVMRDLARRVSRYASSSPSEFIAETYAGLRTGRKYDRDVMQAYREAMGLSNKPLARLRSRLPRRRKAQR